MYRGTGFSRAANGVFELGFSPWAQRVDVFYQSGEEIKKGDRVTFHEQPGEVEFVADAPGDSETKWFVEEYGGGVMVVEISPKTFGRVFVTQTDNTEDLVLVSRGDETQSAP